MSNIYNFFPLLDFDDTNVIIDDHFIGGLTSSKTGWNTSVANWVIQVWNDTIDNPWVLNFSNTTWQLWICTLYSWIWSNWWGFYLTNSSKSRFTLKVWTLMTIWSEEYTYKTWLTDMVTWSGTPNNWVIFSYTNWSPNWFILIYKNWTLNSSINTWVAVSTWFVKLDMVLNSATAEFSINWTNVWSTSISNIPLSVRLWVSSRYAKTLWWTSYTMTLDRVQFIRNN